MMGSMIERRRFLEQIEQRLGWSPVVALLGARQVGKTTLARQFVAGRDAHYFDQESPATQELLQEPATRLEPLKGLVVLVEAQRLPRLFPLHCPPFQHREADGRPPYRHEADPGSLRSHKIKESVRSPIILMVIGGLLGKSNGAVWL